MKIRRLLSRLFLAILALFAALVLIVLAGFLALWWLSPGTAQPVTDAAGREIPGAISTVETVTLGGVEQYLIIRGENRDAPVMLFLHGGPGSAEYPFFRAKNQGLERDFVMVYWQQRGASKSFSPDIAPETMTLDRFVSDTAELAELLADRFGKDKVYLLGHSWGSLLGIKTAEAHPELFHAYFGTGQIGHQYEGERMALDWLRARAAATGNTEALAELAPLTLPAADAAAPEWVAYLGSQRKWLDWFGVGMTHDPTGFRQIVGWLLSTPEYRLRDKSNYLRGAKFSAAALWHEMASADLIDELGSLDLPVIFLQGAHDYQTPTPLARALFDALEAPEKHFYSFEMSAHSPPFEEPDRFNALIRQHAGLE